MTVMTVTSRRDPVDDFDEMHKESLDAMNARIVSSFGIARKMFEILNEADLSLDGRTSAMQFLNVLVHRFGKK